MSQAKTTKIFGMTLTIDPKLIVLLLIILAGLIYYFTSNSDSPSSSATAVSSLNPIIVKPAPSSSLNARAIAQRRANALRNDRGTLKLIAIDGSRGDVDPTLRLLLLERLKSVPEASASIRNLFDAAGNPATAPAAMPALPPHGPKIPMGQPGQLVSTEPPPPPPPPPFSIPLKYYGFVKPVGHDVEGNRGFFMDGDNILVGAEGDMLEKKFLIVALTPNVARLEDTTVKQGQDLQVTPEAGTSQ